MCLILVRQLDCDSLNFRQKQVVSRSMDMDIIYPHGQDKEPFLFGVHAINFNDRSLYLLLLLYSNPVTQKFTTDANYRED